MLERRRDRPIPVLVEKNRSAQAGAQLVHHEGRAQIAQAQQRVGTPRDFERRRQFPYVIVDVR